MMEEIKRVEKFLRDTPSILIDINIITGDLLLYREAHRKAVAILKQVEERLKNENLEDDQLLEEVRQFLYS